MAGVRASRWLFIFLLEVIFFVSVDGASAPNLFTVHFLTDISDTPISIQVGGQVSDSFFLHFSPTGESDPSAPG